MGIDYSGNYGVGIRLRKAKFTKEMINEGIDCMEEYIEDISEKIPVEVEYFETGFENYGGDNTKYFICLKKPFKKGVYQQKDSDELIKYLDENNIKYYGHIDHVGGLSVT